ncbi:MAG: hypothetical protein WC391_03395 [Methanoregula sp.]|jgi:uncharacterized protein YceK
MKTILILIATACLILVAGCSTISSPSQTVPGSSLKMNEPAALSGGNYSFNASISEISVDSSATGGHTINIFITAKNTGTNPVRLTWFSKLTGPDGTTFGGVNVSHGGAGAHSSLLSPGLSETARDYVVVQSDKEYAALSHGAMLDVAFSGQQDANETPVTLHASWTIDPAYFK